MIFTTQNIGNWVLGDSATWRIQMSIQDMFTASPLGKVRYLFGVAFSNLIAAAPALLVLSALLIYVRDQAGEPIPWYFWPILIGSIFILWVLFSAVGVAISSRLRSQREVWPVGNLSFTILGMLSPLYYPLSYLPKWWQAVAHFLPATYAALLLQGALGITVQTPLAMIEDAGLLAVSASAGYPHRPPPLQVAGGLGPRASAGQNVHPLWGLGTPGASCILSGNVPGPDDLRTGRPARGPFSSPFARSRWTVGVHNQWGTKSSMSILSALDRETARIPGAGGAASLQQARDGRSPGSLRGWTSTRPHVPSRTAWPPGGRSWMGRCTSKGTTAPGSGTSSPVLASIRRRSRSPTRNCPSAAAGDSA